MKSLLLVFLFVSILPGEPIGRRGSGCGIPPEEPGTPNIFIDPTGTYILKGATSKNKVVGHSGEIRIKLLGKDRVAMSFYINKGYPGYESGSFLDTLLYNDDNEAVYTPAKDPGCAFLFYFSANSAETLQVLSNPESGCGFGKGVMASARFEKYSGEAPIIQDLSARGAAL
jgi:hypothetical protein